MAQTGLIRIVCTAALLAAAPAFAQTNMPTGDTAAGGAPNNPTAHEAMPNSAMTPADKMGSQNTRTGTHAMTDDYSTHRGAMAHHSSAMHGRSDGSQDAAVDQLNDQSYQAARSGQAFNNTGGTMAPSGTGGMNDMHNGSMSPNGSAGANGKM